MILNQKNYVVIIGDIANSRKIKNRKESQKGLIRLLDTINTEYSDDIASKFSITLGDEFQGLLNNGKNTMRIINKIQMEMEPLELRFGVGIGGINTDINFEKSAEIDGPAYYSAREMIKEIEDRKSEYTKGYSNIMIDLGKHNVESSKLLNSILCLCTALKSKWTTRQKEVIKQYFKNDENQYKTADALNIGQPSVSKSLKSSKFYSYNSAINTVALFLSGEGML